MARRWTTQMSRREVVPYASAPPAPLCPRRPPRRRRPAVTPSTTDFVITASTCGGTTLAAAATCTGGIGAPSLPDVHTSGPDGGASEWPAPRTYPEVIRRTADVAFRSEHCTISIGRPVGGVVVVL